MESQKKPSKRKVELPDWGDEIKPSEDVMAMFYAPTGIPKPGPITPVLPVRIPDQEPIATPVAQTIENITDNVSTINSVGNKQSDLTQPNLPQPNPAQPSPIATGQESLVKESANSGQREELLRTGRSTQTKIKKASAAFASTPLPKLDVDKEEQRVDASSIAPSKDFNRRANSIERDAMPSGLFPGTSKKLYDALYLRTRGAIVPCRTIQATKRELMIWSGIRSKNTIALHLQHLNTVGLIARHFDIGNPDGSLYEIRLPEEIGEIEKEINEIKNDVNEINFSDQIDPAQPSPTQPSPAQKLGWDPTQKLGWVGLGNNIDNKEVSHSLKTSFKTDHDDDDHGALRALFRSYFPEADQTKVDQALGEIEELLTGELRKRVSHASTPPISLAYFVECVRRLCSASNRSEITPIQANKKRPNRGYQKKQLIAIIDRLKTVHVGATYTIGELAEDTKMACLREGIEFDNDLFGEIINHK